MIQSLAASSLAVVVSSVHDHTGVVVVIFVVVIIWLHKKDNIKAYKKKMKIALQGLEELKKHLDTNIVVPNQNLFKISQIN